MAASTAGLNSGADWAEIIGAAIIVTGVVWGAGRRAWKRLLAEIKDDLKKDVAEPLADVKKQVTSNGGTEDTLGDRAVRIETLAQDALDASNAARSDAAAARSEAAAARSAALDARSAATQARQQIVEHLEQHGRPG